jgi:hypothetical protein
MQRGYAEGLVPLVTLLAYAFGGALLLILIASILVPTVRLKGKARIGGVLAVIGVWVGLYWWNSGEPERISLTHSPHYKHFTAACQKAGTTIFRKVDDVTSLAFQAPRTATSDRDLQDKNFVGDVYGGFDLMSSAAETGLVRTYLTKKEWEQRWHVPTNDEFLRYPQVEIIAEQGGQQGAFQYTDSSVGSRQEFSRTFSSTPVSRFLVSWEDVSTSRDRENWVAGSKWKVVDRLTGEVLAERVAYAIDLDQGRTKWDGGTGAAGEAALPWLRAGNPQYRRYKVENSCPPKSSPRYNLEFVRAVLQPVAQEMKVIPIARQ